MEYVLIFCVVAAAVIVGLAEGQTHNRLKKKGVKTTGIIIANKELKSSANDFYRLGGNINEPTVQFFTQDGRQITGTPVLKFVTQYEVAPPIQVTVLYDANQPELFCIDFK